MTLELGEAVEAALPLFCKQIVAATLAPGPDALEHIVKEFGNGSMVSPLHMVMAIGERSDLIR